MPVDARPFTDPEIMADSNKTGTAATRKRLKGENSCDDPSHEVPKRKKVYNTWEFCGVCVSVWCTGAGGGGGGGGGQSALALSTVFILFFGYLPIIAIFTRDAPCMFRLHNYSLTHRSHL